MSWVSRIGGMLCVASLGGCYTYTPMTPGVAPAAGQAVSLEISDAGRVGLADRFGPGLLRVQGRLTGVTSDYALNVYRVAFIGAPASRWTGEAVRIDRNFVGQVLQRQLSRGRTAAAVGVIVLAVGAIAISTDLVGFWSGTDEPPPPPEPSSQRVGAQFAPR